MRPSGNMHRWRAAIVGTAAIYFLSTALAAYFSIKLTQPQSRTARAWERHDERASHVPAVLPREDPLPALIQREHQHMAVSTTAAVATPSFLAICPRGFSLEEHNGDPDHGDLCRAHGSSGDFECPVSCIPTAHAPWCVGTTGNATVCRADDQFSTRFTRLDDAPTMACPSGFSQLSLRVSALIDKNAVNGIHVDSTSVSICVNNTHPREWGCPLDWFTLSKEPFCTQKRVTQNVVAPPVGHDFGPGPSVKTMHTFFHPIGATVPRIQDQAILDAWAVAWASAGWATRILTLEDAQKHHRYKELSARISKLPLGGNIEYDRMCYIR